MPKYTDNEIDQLIDKAIARHSREWDEKFEKSSLEWHEKFNRTSRDWDKKFTRTDAEWQKKLNEAAEHAVGVYYEKTKHDFDLIMEALDSMKEQHDNKANREDLKEIKDEVKTLKLALTDANQDLKSHDKRIGELESKIIHA